jgi:GrpB-like predicted nucleotidyltransferase (UPF0157 family)
MKITIVEYSPAWIEGFEREKQLLQSVLEGNSCVIEHIGSTSVIGLAAKPVIDIMIGLRDFSTASDLVPKIEALGYEYIRKYEEAMPYRRYFQKRSAGTVTHHIHMVEIDGEFWKRHLLFRDFLRANPDAASDYAAFKKELAKIEWDNSNVYAKAKTVFIKGIENKARRRN